MVEVALETPENVSYIYADKRTRWPDLAVAGTCLVGGEYVKHVRLAGLARDLRAQGAGSTDSALGWAVTGSAKLGLPFLGSKDNFKITLHYGDGYGTQIKGGPQEGAFNPVSSELETIGIFGSYSGIQHFWSERWRRPASRSRGLYYRTEQCGADRTRQGTRCRGRTTNHKYPGPLGQDIYELHLTLFSVEMLEAENK